MPNPIGPNAPSMHSAAPAASLAGPEPIGALHRKGNATASGDRVFAVREGAMKHFAGFVMNTPGGSRELLADLLRI